LPGVGWALGVDRTVLALDAEGVELPVPPACQVFAVPIGDAAKRRLFGLVAELRTLGVAADLAYGDRGMKGAMKAADRSGAAYAVVLGERDLEAGVAQVKDLASGEQTALPWDGLAADLKRRVLP
jgi:histidyl-tRNA synthetase